MRVKVWVGLVVFAVIIVTSVIVISQNRTHNRGKPTGSVTIGAVLPLSGKSAQYGKWIREGLELGREEINSSGGINGKKLEIIYEDDAANPREAANAMQKLVRIDKVPLVFGSWASSCALAQAPIAESSHTVLMAEAISPKLRDAGKYVYRIQPDARYYIRELVPFVFRELRLHTVCILYVNNDFGLDQADVFETEFTKLGGKVLSKEGYSAEATDFRTALLKIKEKNPQAVFVPGYGELGIILKQAREIGLTQQFIGSVPAENPDILQTAGKAAEGLIYPHHFDPDSSDELVRKYQDSYKRQYGRPSEGFAALAYDGIRVIAHAIESGGDSPNGIRKKLDTTRAFPGVTGPTAFDDHGDVIKPILIKTVDNGSFVPVRRSVKE